MSDDFDLLDVFSMSSKWASNWPADDDFDEPYVDFPEGLDWSSRRALILNRDGYICRKCKNDANQVDHKWPVSLGGDDEPDNLQALCGRCNKSKGDAGFFCYLTRRQLKNAENHFTTKACNALLETMRFRRIGLLVAAGSTPEDAHDGAGAYGTHDDLEAVFMLAKMVVRSTLVEHGIPVEESA